MHTDRRYKEIAGILVLMLSLIIALSLAGYHITDYAQLAENRPVKHVLGPLGAAVGAGLRTAFGYPAYLIFAMTALAGWSVLRRGSAIFEIERIFALVYLAITSSALFALVSTSGVPQFAGGYLGVYVAVMLTRLAGSVGAYLIVIILNLIGLIFLGALSLAFLSEGDRRTGDAFMRAWGVITQAFATIASRITRRKTTAGPDTDATETRSGKKPPWITKKRIRIGDDDAALEKELALNTPRLLEMMEQTSRATAPDPFDALRETYRAGRARRIGPPAVDDASDCAALANDAPDDEEIVFTPDEIQRPVTPGVVPNRITSIESEPAVRDAVPASAMPDQAARRSTPAVALADPPVAVEEDEDDEDAADCIIAQSPHRDEMALDELGDDADGPAPAGDAGVERVFDEIGIKSKYAIPMSYLKSSVAIDVESWKSEARRNSELLVNTLRDFGIESKVVRVNRGPVLTLYELQIAPGIKVNRIVALSDDIAMALAASRVRIVAPIPGKSAIGVEVPNTAREMVTLGDIKLTEEYGTDAGRLKVALGKDILGNPVTLDIRRLPHLLIAGATGSGKSVCVNAIITSLIYNYDPNYVRFILVDPKMVELQLYDGVPHLLMPVIVEPHVVPKSLKWAMYEMERRYKLLSALCARDIERYNEKAAASKTPHERLPYIVIIMDELADLMMVAAKEIEGFITRIAQKARAVGIHLVLATQRPSVDVITGIIKANFPARIAFQVAQKTDSRTIIDQNGAEKLLGKGDMLYQSPMSSFPIRVQGAYIAEDEIMAVVEHLKKLAKPAYINIEESIFDEDADDEDAVEDELFVEALKIVEDSKKASASYLQRRLSIGYNRAARIIELMEERGYIGPQTGSKPREVFI
ncbi:MAG TPA: DNA translocase FtsK [Spirochaetota bacterium]|nr:DNA translocase FtsK [Spirochaetota bacterium]